ncbi:MAG: endonuclease Q family protein [bacterium]
MEFIADFHLHSKYSRATSADMDIPEMARFAKLKGISLLGSSDFTHPVWLSNLKAHLKEIEGNLFEHNGIKFILTSEVSNIYKDKEKLAKVHIIIFSPSFEICDRINEKLQRYGSLFADGRPTLSLSSPDLVKMLLDIDSRIFIVPAHIWTPHFSVFGANSGFNSISECFKEESPHIYCLETGLSSDPKMNWRLSMLDKYTLISNSDAHSPAKIGREANVFNCEISYNAIISVLKNKDKSKFLKTLEFFPEEGKYHYDGHRNCQISLSPDETKKLNLKCPKCGKKLTIGVMHRVCELSDRDPDFIPENSIPYKNLIPLDEIIGGALEKEPTSVVVKREYLSMVENIGTEFDILLKKSENELKKGVSQRIFEGIMNVRKGMVDIEPGYDGVYGRIEIFKKGEKKPEQMSLF